MSTPKTEKLLRTIRTNSRGMFCESCNRSTVAKRTTTRIYKGGREVERQLCGNCGDTQETEYFKGPTTRIKEKSK